MESWLISLITVISTGLCFVLWFREVRRIMRDRKSTVESAGGQLSACRERARKTQSDPDCAAILERSENIYHQAVTIYNQTLQKPWNYLPAHLMGFHYIS